MKSTLAGWLAVIGVWVFLFVVANRAWREMLIGSTILMILLLWQPLSRLTQ